MRISDYPRDAAERGELLRRALGVASRDDDSRGRISQMNRVNRLARLQVRGRRHRARIHHHDVRATGVR